ncbi:hypothetical protein [Lysobacter gummosus]|uniref:hypothetical protein n=1 Tax=Lysobacter gummosus TaxID=262324 RepID=UPI003630840C
METGGEVGLMVHGRWAQCDKAGRMPRRRGRDSPFSALDVRPDSRRPRACWSGHGSRPGPVRDDVPTRRRYR